MTLIDSINLWRIQNNNNFYFEDMDIDERIDKNDIYMEILLQYSDMQCVFADTSLMYKAVQHFWKDNKPRIAKLIDTTELVYNPIEDYNTTTHAVGNKDFKQDDNTVKVGNKTYSEDVVEDEDEVYAETKVTDNNGSYSENKVEDTDRTYSETENRDQTDRHFVSAFNQTTGDDVLQTRDTSSIDRTTKGTENIDKTTTTNGTTTNNETVNTNGTDNTDTTTKTTGTVNTKDTTDYGSVQNTGTTDNETKIGLTHFSYEDLVQQQRRVVQFSITEWILKQWAKELMVSIW